MTTRLSLILRFITTYCGAEIARLHRDAQCGYSHIVLQDGATFGPFGAGQTRYLEDEYPRIARYLESKGYVLGFYESWFADASGRYWPIPKPEFRDCADASERIAHGLHGLHRCHVRRAYAVSYAFDLSSIKGLHSLGCRYWEDVTTELGRFIDDHHYLVVAQDMGSCRSRYFVGRRSVLEREN